MKQDIDIRFENEVYHNSDAIQDLNTYRNWGLFHLQDEPIFDGGVTDAPKEGEDRPKITYNEREWFTDKSYGPDRKFLGTKSLFNNVNAVSFGMGAAGHGYRVANNMPLLDTQAMRDRLRERGGCSIRELCEDSAAGLMGRAIYNYSDFMFCKHLGKVSNNYLVTLRRFPFPAGDHINFTEWGSKQQLAGEYKTNRHLPDIGRLVTWMGTPGNDLNEILKYNVLMPYEELKAEVQESRDASAENGGFLGSLMNLSNNSYASKTLNGVAGEGTISILNNMIGSPKLPNFMGGGPALAAPQNTSWAYHRDATKPYGPVDVISRTHKRVDGSGGGLTFEQEINLTFDYELRSYDGINGKAAILDLLGNILAVTFTNGIFWGGAIHSNAPSQSSLFTNLPIFHMKAPADFNQLKDASLQSVQDIARGFNGGKKVSSVSDIINITKQLLSNVGNLLVGGALNAIGRPQKEALNSLIKNDPVGLWHLTIGNPKHPIMSMGNMILSKVEVQHYGPLGLDDFPTGLKVNIGLKHAMPRDRMKIEQMYTMGDYRIYTPMGKNIEYMYESAQESGKFANGDIVKKFMEGETGDVEKLSTMYNDVVDDVTSVSFEKDLGKRYMKYFGTTDKCSIGKASREGHMGSSKAKTTTQVKKELESK